MGGEMGILAVGLNEEFDRTYTATCRITEGSLPYSQTLQITQLGLREPFEPSNYSEGLITADNQDFGVLKEE